MKILFPSSLGFLVLFLSTSFADYPPNKNIKSRYDVFYTTEKDTLQSLDVFWNENQENSPIVLFVHGGGWLSGDKKAYREMASTMADQGLTVMLVNYRLSPKVKFPEHVEDVAASIAWAKNNAKDYSGDPQKLYLMGHSAGAQMITLLTFDPHYLDKVDVSPDEIAGLITISGVFEIKTQKGGASKKYLEMVFGMEEVWKKASCQTYLDKAKSNLPPLLVTWVDDENELIKNESIGLIKVLENAGVEYRSYIFEGNNHNAFVTELQNSSSTFSKELMDFIAVASPSINKN